MLRRKHPVGDCICGQLVCPPGKGGWKHATFSRVRLHSENGIAHDDCLDISNQFRYCIEEAYRMTGRQVVVLVDEYDKPLLTNLGVSESQEERNRNLFKGFFSVLKDEDQYLKFIFITGVTKFSKVSIFSDLNQLKDISLFQSRGSFLSGKE